jgi:hypothetical protein
MSEPRTPELPLEDFAAVRAELDAERDLAAALSAYELTAAEWHDAEDAWLAKLGWALDHGEMDLLHRYDDMYQEACTRLAIPVPTPSHVREAEPVSLRGDDETAFLRLEEPGAKALPFLPGPANALPPTTVEAHPSAGATAIARRPTEGAGVLPFGDATEDDPPGSDTGPDRTRMATQHTGVFAAARPEAPLPFVSTAPRATAPVADEDPHRQAGATAELPVASRRRALVPFAPVTPRGATRVGHLTLQEAAALDIEIAENAGRITETLAKFGFDRNAFTAHRSALEWLLQDDVALARAFRAERETYASWLRERR